jgi:hypothetical protein
MTTELFDFIDLFEKLDHYFEDNIRLSVKTFTDNQNYDRYILIITKDDLFYRIDLKDDNIPNFILNNDEAVIESMRVEELSQKEITDYVDCYPYHLKRNYGYYNNYLNNFSGNVEEYVEYETISEFDCHNWDEYYFPLLLTRSGDVLEYKVVGMLFIVYITN